MDEISLKALAKINLGLDVLGKREDGYHDVRMIMQTIHLYDRVEIKKTRSPHIHVETNLYYLPVNEDNLVYRAAIQCPISWITHAHTAVRANSGASRRQKTAATAKKPNSKEILSPAIFTLIILHTV